MDLITTTDSGLCCKAGGFYIDPWKKCELALISHAHADHARNVASKFIATPESEPILRHRLGHSIDLDVVKYGEKFKLGDIWVSFHPASHILGSAQIRVEMNDHVWVFTGDYKRDFDPTCVPFEVVECDVFITEATFGLPVYTWDPGGQIAKEIYDWWQGDPSRPTLLFCYSLGKSQRVLAELSKYSERLVYLHGAVTELTEIYRSLGVEMLPTMPVSETDKTHDFAGDLIIAPPSAHRSPWMKRFKSPQTGFASGWMQVRGSRRRMGYERGFALSDHADWPGLINTIRETQAKRVYVTHGDAEVLSRYLSEEMGIEALPLKTLYEGESGD